MELKELRKRGSSLREFLNRAVLVTSWQELQDIAQ
jgi:hypothetical protein